MTNDEIKAAKARADAATQGPWTIGHNNKWGGIESPARPSDWVIVPAEQEDVDNYDIRKEDWDFIAAARTDVPALAEECLKRGEIIATMRGGAGEHGAGDVLPSTE